MKKQKNLLIIFIFAVLAVLIFVILVPYAKNVKNLETVNQADVDLLNDNLNNDNVLVIETDPGLIMQREAFINENINEISTEPAVLGGTFYVTFIEWIGDDIAQVSYEDGHIALRAQITFNPGEESFLDFSIIPIAEAFINEPFIEEGFVGEGVEEGFVEEDVFIAE